MDAKDGAKVFLVIAVPLLLTAAVTLLQQWSGLPLLDVFSLYLISLLCIISLLALNEVL